MVTRIQMFLALLCIGLVSGCGVRLPELAPPTLIPSEYVPTAVALTIAALDTPTPAPTTNLTASAEYLTPTTISGIPLEEQTQEPDSSDGDLTQGDATAEVSATLSQTGSPAVLNTAEPSPTSPPQVEIPFATIQIIRPGPLSKVASPIELHAFLRTGYGGRATVELLGEDGRLMYRQIFILNSVSNAQVNLLTEIEYEIAGVAETARLVISTHDAQGRLLALTSEDLILLSMGEADINPGGDLLETIVIQQPSLNRLVQGGELIVSGLARPVSDQPMLVELIASDGRVVGSRLAAVSPSPQGNHSLFATEVPYEVSAPTWVRLTVSERGVRLPGVIHLSSVEVLLSP
ncbi:MAG: hypothetical protein PVG32_08505 [Anaerolineales bacterium]